MFQVLSVCDLPSPFRAALFVPTLIPTGWMPFPRVSASFDRFEREEEVSLSTRQLAPKGSWPDSFWSDFFTTFSKNQWRFC